MGDESYQIWVAVIQQSIHQTKTGLLRWEKIDSDKWRASGEIPLEIELLTPIDDTEEPIRNIIARITLTGSSAVTMVCAGTRLMYLIRELLSQIDSAWSSLIETELQHLRELRSVLTDSFGDLGCGDVFN